MSQDLPPLVPPLRFGLVEEGVYRGAYPSLINLRFLTRLGIKSMVSLLPETPAPHLLQWCDHNDVRNHFERISVSREGEEEVIALTHERVADLLQLLVLPERQPVYVHCLDGVAITGMLIMSLRKLQRWAPQPYVAEYARFARDGCDIPTQPPPHALAFVHGFNAEFEFARLLPDTLPAWLEAALAGGNVGGNDRQRRQQAGAADATLGSGTGRQSSSLELRAGEIPRGESHRHERRPSNNDMPGLGLTGLGLGALDPAATLFERKGTQVAADGVTRVSSGLDALAIEGLTMGRLQATHDLRNRATSGLAGASGTDMSRPRFNRNSREG